MANKPVSASDRQQAYVKRLKAKGYVLLSSMYVPAEQRDNIRQLVKNYIDKYEAANKF